ncbi:TnsD family Tn7-like transposition protein [Halalkalibacter akibai]|uniref:Tn7-like transposition protein D n=1 Tax=Halalkalibacter akibai (strain ATCC 43226 / DSM 21942 / CIP 109018 / JCM 9157 / 1139) TaxID=1236973 RepID=W4QZU3_HALA3|nr:TnsD family Tn7-like transposition protein [Halalkalibacter akibai]GAE37188.1 Tn7-like transposition protein D [Halalkalibacter akibai JCM 9157]
MIPYFPSIYPDETLYSVIYRFHVHTGSITWDQTFIQLYGYSQSVTTCSINFPYRISDLVARFPQNWGISEDYILEKCTLLPFYLPFMTVENKKEIKRLMCGSTNHFIVAKFGFASNDDTKIYYCPKCVEEDLVTYHETYLRRFHQVPGVLVCTQHEILLESYQKKLKITFIPSVQNREKVNLTITNEEKQTLLDLAKDIERLQTLDSYSFVLESIYEKYDKLLRDKGYIDKNGIVNVRQISIDFNQFYGSILQVLNLPVKLVKKNWLHNLIKSVGLNHFPIRHVLLMRFLCGSVEEFFQELLSHEKEEEMTGEEAPFGDGPWYCLNPVASHYKQRVIHSLSVRHYSDRGVVVGTFDCRECGYVYTRSYTNSENASDEYKKNTVKHFGPIWEKRLLEMLNENYKIVQITRELDVSYSGIRRIIKRLSKDSNSLRTYDREKTYYKERILRDRQIVEDLIQKEKLGFITFSQVKTHTAQRWLKVHDFDWWSQRFPYKAKKNSEKSKREIEERDNYFLNRITHLIENWGKDGLRPIRISRKNISQELGVRATTYEKLPNTNKFIKANLEKNRDYKFRLVDWICEDLRKDSERVFTAQDVYRKIPIKVPEKWLRQYVEEKIKTLYPGDYFHY